MIDSKSKGLAGKIATITAVVVALTALIAAAGPFYNQTQNLVCQIIPSLCTNGEDKLCSPGMPLAEYLACQREN